jgi:iron donor protein CyaY
MDEQEFRRRSDEALGNLQRALERASENHAFDVDRNEGALTVEFEDPPAKFVFSPNSPVRQIWVSARVQSFKLDWNPDRSAFVLPNGKTLQELVADVVSQQMNEPVQLS